MVKVVVSDVDGTLVEDGTSNLNPEYYDVIRQLSAKGIQVIIASGRQYASVKKLFEPVSDLLCYVVEGGSMLAERGKSVEVLHPIPAEWAKEMMQDAHKLSGTDVMISTPRTAYAPEKDSEMYRWIRDSYHFDIEPLGGWSEFPDEPVGKISVYHASDAEGVCADWFTPKWGSKLNACCAGSCWMDFVSADVSKAAALKELCKRLQVDLKDVYAFGDNMNDIAMLECVGESFAVENAREEVKEVANQIIPCYQEDGVLQIWKAILRSVER